MNLIFAGTPDFAAAILSRLLTSHHQIVAVITQPDRPSGRGLKLKPSPVKSLALAHALPLYQPASLKDTELVKSLISLQAEAMVVAAYGVLLPITVLQAFPRGCINVHPSLLPRWRGAAPIPRTILAGDSITGVSIMQMDQGLDTGPVFLKRQYVLRPDETTKTLHDKLAILGAETLIETLDLLKNKSVTPSPQDAQLATYATKINKVEALLDWTQNVTALDQYIRAFNPWPVAYTSWKGQHLRIWEAKIIALASHVPARTIVHADREGIDIATGQGILRLLKMQLPGGKVLSVQDFYNVWHKDLIVGQHFS